MAESFAERHYRASSSHPAGLSGPVTDLRPPPETPQSWPFEKPPRLQVGSPKFRRGGAVYIWLLLHYDAVTARLADPDFRWRDLAYEIGKAVCNPGRFQPPTPAMTAETWNRLCRDVQRIGYHPAKYADAVFPGAGTPAEDFPPLPPPPEPRPPAASFAEVAATVRKVPNGRRSELSRWLIRHRAEFAAVLAEDREFASPNWSAWAENLAAQGIVNRDGRAPTADAMRMAWKRIERQARGRQAPAPHSSVRMAEPAAGAVAPPAPALPGTDAEVTEKLRAFRASLNAGKVRIPEPVNPRKPDGNP